MNKIRVIGDDIYYDGYAIAMVGTHAPCSVKAAFEDFIQDATTSVRIELDDAQPAPQVVDDDNEVARIIWAEVDTIVESCKGKSGLIQHDTIKRAMARAKQRIMEDNR